MSNLLLALVRGAAYLLLWVLDLAGMTRPAQARFLMSMGASRLYHQAIPREHGEAFAAGVVRETWAEHFNMRNRP